MYQLKCREKKGNPWQRGGTKKKFYYLIRGEAFLRGKWEYLREGEHDGGDEEKKKTQKKSGKIGQTLRTRISQKNKHKNKKGGKGTGKEKKPLFNGDPEKTGGKKKGQPLKRPQGGKSVETKWHEEKNKKTNVEMVTPGKKKKKMI